MRALTVVFGLALSPAQPTSNHVHTFLIGGFSSRASIAASFTNFKAHHEQIQVVHPTYYRCGPDGAIEGTNNPEMTAWAQMHDIDVLPRIMCMDAVVQHEILTNEATRTNTLEFIEQTVVHNGYDGIDIDFEGGYISDRDALTEFIALLAQRLHSIDKTLSMAIAAKDGTELPSSRSQFFDYDGLSQHADWLFVMTWGKTWSTSPPGPTDPLNWVTDVADYVASRPRKERYILGFLASARDWEANDAGASPAESLTYSEAMERAAQHDVSPTLDPSSFSLTYDYVAPNGDTHTVWLSNARTIAARVQLARSRGLCIGFWRLGQEDEEVWATSFTAPTAESVSCYRGAGLSTAPPSTYSDASLHNGHERR